MILCTHDHHNPKHACTISNPQHTLQFSYHQNIATYYGAFVRKGDPGHEDQLWVSQCIIDVLKFNFSERPVLHCLLATMHQESLYSISTSSSRWLLRRAAVEWY